MRIVVRIVPEIAAALQKSLLSSKTVETTQKDWAITRTKCAAADVGICNWMGINRGYFYSLMFVVIASD